MPIYEYECTKCELRHEEWRKISTRDVPGICRNCLEPTQHVITPVRGRVDKPAAGGYGPHLGDADQFTADALGFKKKDLMTDPSLAGLRHDGPGNLNLDPGPVKRID